MTQKSVKAPGKKGLTPFGVIAFLIGIGLFAYFVKQAGVGQILEGIGRLGAGFGLVIAISAIRPIVRALAWTLCMEAPYRLRFRDAVRARIMGDALGNVIPFAGFLVSEPSKAALIRDRVPLAAGIPALAIESLFYSLSVTLFIFAGMTALLLSFNLPKGLRTVSIVTLVLIVFVIAAGVALIFKRLKVISGAARLLQRRGLDAKWVEKSQSVEERIYGFYSRSQSRFLPIILLECCFHLAGVLEIYVTLSFISPDQSPTFLTAFILESVNRVITLAFKFIPLKVGVDEAGTGRVSRVLGFTIATGVTLAIVRKARDVFWAGIGMILLLQRGLSLRAIARDAEQALANETRLTVPPNLSARQSS